jgi:starch synthase
MDVLFVSPSALPYPVEAGAAEAALAQAKALRSLGHRVSIVAPHPDEPDPGLSSLARRLDPLSFEVAGKVENVSVYDGRTTAGIEWILLSHPALRDLFEDDASGLFAQVVLARSTALLLHRERAFDVVHFHGEETALAATSVALEKRVKTVFGTYSLSAPLSFPAALAAGVGLEALVREDGRLVPSLSAIACATRVVTSVPAGLVNASLAGSAPSQRAASDDAAQKVATALRARGGELSLAPFGLDGAVWNPVIDTHLFARFTPVDLSGKARNKAMLQSELKLEIDPNVALLGAIESALGAERIYEAVSELVRTDVQLVVQVIDEDAPSIEPLIALSERMPHRVQVRIGDSQMRAHRILAASDALLLASDKPTLSMAAQRYGAVPVARAGSLSAEAIVDIDAKMSAGTGILYDNRSSEALIAGARRAIAAFNRGAPFERLRTRLMQIDHSFERAARALEHVYAQALEIEAA